GVRSRLQTELKHFVVQVESLSDSQALFERGLALARGEGLLQDFGEAALCFRKAAQQGHAGAQLHLGVLYERGEGVSQDFEEAMRWYQKAADQRQPHATCHMAGLYW